MLQYNCMYDILNMLYYILQGISVDLFEQISELLSKTFRTSVSRTLT